MLPTHGKSYRKGIYICNPLSQPLTDSELQAFLSFFYCQPKARKTVNVSKRRAQRKGQTQASRVQDEVEDVQNEDDEDLDAVENPEREFVDEHLAELNRSDDAPDEGKVAHDDVIVKTIREEAKREAAKRGIVLNVHEEKEAQGLMPKVCCLQSLAER